MMTMTSLFFPLLPNVLYIIIIVLRQYNDVYKRWHTVYRSINAVRFNSIMDNCKEKKKSKVITWTKKGLKKYQLKFAPGGTVSGQNEPFSDFW